MGSDLGHENDTSNKVLNAKKWSNKEKEILRLLLSNNVGSILLCVLIELMIYNYTVCQSILFLDSLEPDFSTCYK